jgi:lipopolysaccharide assembly protein A
MWLIARASKWALNRRIATLENSVKAATVSPPIGTSTQFEAAAADAPAADLAPADQEPAA